MRKYLPVVALVLAACAFFMLGGKAFRHFWERWLVVSVPMEHADALIVLGGEPLARTREAERLYHQGMAQAVFVTGVGDAMTNRKILLGEGVPARVIVTEAKASTTYENALLLKPLLEAAHVRTAMIVTSPFHTRRALATFRKVIPDICFGVTDASIGWWNRPEGQGDVNRFAMIEFLKTIEYWMLYGVSPVLEKRQSSLGER